MRKKLEAHQREYFLVSITIGLRELFSEDFSSFFGGVKISEAVIIIKNGIYYWASIPEEFVLMTKGFMKRVENDEVDLADLHEWYCTEVANFEKLISTPEDKFNLEMLGEFYEHYRRTFKVICCVSYAMDFINDISPEKRKETEKYLTSMRLRGEKSPKDGEKEFIPKYLAWLSKNYLPNYSQDDLKYVLFYEMENYLRSGAKLPDVSELKKRKKSFVYHINSQRKEIVLSGKEADEFIENNNFFTEENYDDTKQLIGQIAQGGEITGRVNIILSTKDLVKFKEGEVMVSQMTDPSYLPAMKQAAAFVTDEGGLLCHAAIVARELKKPCIIGTKIATKVLRDGDMVEVDANSGVVRILNKQ